MPSSDDPRTEGRGLPLLDDQLLISVAVPRPLLGLFTYRISSVLAAQVKVGGWVKVPFGRSLTVAFVVEPPRPMSDIPVGLTLEQLKEVTEVSEPEVALPLEVLQLCRWTQDYTFSPLGEVLNCAAPAAAIGLKKMKRPPKQVRVSVSPSSPLYALTSEQNRAVQAIEECRSSTKTHVILLQGVTGSGKTDVYIEYAKKVLTQGKGVLILVPEIALTPQLHQRFESGLGVPVALWHSAVSPSKRRDHAVALQTGEVRTVVGARSAVFAPVQNLGLVVVDEEHDPTYKQEDRVRYHARDLAVVRAKLAGAVVVLGSATPSLETRERVREERYLKTSLNKRFATGGLPQIDLVDLKIEEKVENIQAPLAKRTLEAIQKEIDSGGQVIVYLNRRGFASFLLCKDCGEVSQCLHCSVSLTVHKQAKQMRCHQCGFHHSIPDACSKCHGDHLFAMGAGTESLEGELPTLLQGVKVIRLDRDQITSATRLNEILSEFRNRKANILLGTQMLVKGHDFPGVTLVVVILADALFRWPDFRASERAYQILKQVSGRAGRGEKAGRVMIQTYSPEHSVLQTILGNLEEEAFLESERELRQVLGYPPFGRLARLRFESPDRNVAILRSKAIAQRLQCMPLDKERLDVLGPSEAFLEKVRGIFRWDLLLKTKYIQDLQRAVSLARDECAKNRWQMIIDIDPYGL